MRHLLLITLVLPLFTFAQRNYIDSLLSALRKPVKHDSIRARQFSELAWSYLDYNMDSARLFADEAIRVSRKSGFQDGEMDALNTLGIIYRSEGRYKEAIHLYQEIIAARTANGENDKLTGPYSNLGSTYYESGKFGEALSWYQKAYQIALGYKQNENILILANNIGVGYKKVGLLEQALNYFQKGLEENKRIKDQAQQGVLYSNIATVYQEKGMPDEAIYFSELAREILTKQNLLIRSPSLLYNLVILYRNKQNYVAANETLEEFKAFAKQMDEPAIWSDYYLSVANLQNDLSQQKNAEKNVDRALSYLDGEENPSNYAIVLNAKAQILLAGGRNEESLKTVQLAEKYVQQSEDSSILLTTYQIMTDLYKTSGDYQNALKYAELGNNLTKKLELNAIHTQLATLNSLNRLEQKEQQLRIAAENNKRVKAESERKSVFIYAMIAVGLLILLLLFLAYRSTIQRKRANQELLAKNEQIDRQKSLIEEKQEEIVASIQYAKRIQDTLLAETNEIRKIFPQSFLFFQPKDIVSGDFYWSASTDENFYLAICDSTGHGVPGAFMSALNSTFLTEAIGELQLTEPGMILDHARHRLLHSISRDGAKDGMDGVLIRLHVPTQKLSYAAAYNAPILLRNGESIKCPADRMPIGLSDKTQPFSTFELDLQRGDTLILSTDGYIDQFGGNAGKKLKSSGFIEILRQLPESGNASAYLQNQFEQWMNSNEQIDDVCVFGLIWTESAGSGNQ